MSLAEYPLIIVNPVSGVGDSKDRSKNIEEIAKKLGWDGELVETTKKISALQISQDAINKKVKHVIVCGGDGTVLESIGALINKDVLLSIVPMGTGNIFALNLGIPTDIEKALKRALKGAVRKIDVGRANKIYFGINAGVGFDTEMMDKTSRKQKDRFGMLAYLASGLKLLSKPSGTYTVLIDNKREKTFKARSVLVANMEKTAGGVKAVPGANPKSGTLKIGIIKPRSLTNWLNVLFNAIRGNINDSPHYDLLEGEHIEIIPKRAAPFQRDGNVFPPTKKLTIDIYKTSLSIKY